MNGKRLTLFTTRRIVGRQHFAANTFYIQDSIFQLEKTFFLTPTTVEKTRDMVKIND